MGSGSDHPLGGMEPGYVCVSTTRQSLDRQFDALAATGIGDERIYVDKKTGTASDRDGLNRPLARARRGDAIVVHTAAKTGIPKTSLHRYLATASAGEQA